MGELTELTSINRLIIILIVQLDNRLSFIHNRNIHIGFHINCA